MAINSVSATSALSGDQLAAASRTVSNELGKDAFLRLLIAELSNQDPLNPMDDREFITQMAQFSTLEQMTNMTTALEGLSSMEQYSAASYVGRLVAFSYTGDDGVPTGVADVVAAVWFDPNEGVILETLNYGNIPLSQIEGVGAAATAAPSGETEEGEETA
ncbi:MAG: flagellar hook assembly protein FlgD [Synergistaceae bacterium]|jgi:flagellar basal-body rod modification protein FlgD|nr:flagellar hook assembly protein FlgD [Synergistaceae bacterium]